MSGELRDARDNNANNNDINNDDGDMNKNINFNRREDSPSRANNKGSEKVKRKLFLARLGKRGRSGSRHAHKEEIRLGTGASHHTRIDPNTRTMTSERRRIKKGFSINVNINAGNSSGTTIQQGSEKSRDMSGEVAKVISRREDCEMGQPGCAQTSRAGAALSPRKAPKSLQTVTGTVVSPVL